MRIGHRLTILCLTFVTATVTTPHEAFLIPSNFDNFCAGCHSNDNPTCNGCHHHGPVGLSAMTDKATYACGEQVSVTFDGGSQSGWIRALLFDHNGVEIDRASGPTGMGDDSEPNPVEFPVTLTASAPLGPGIYDWEAAWWGSPYDTGNPTVHPHGPEVRVPVVVEVTGPSAVEASTWSKIKVLFR